MRMWKVDPKLMCNRHLFGEHLDMHMFVGMIKSGREIKEFIDDGSIETGNIEFRHKELVKEIKARGFEHETSLSCNFDPSGKIDPIKNIEELKSICSDCRRIMEKIL